MQDPSIVLAMDAGFQPHFAKIILNLQDVSLLKAEPT